MLKSRSKYLIITIHYDAVCAVFGDTRVDHDVPRPLFDADDPRSFSVPIQLDQAADWIQKIIKDNRYQHSWKIEDI